MRLRRAAMVLLVAAIGGGCAPQDRGRQVEAGEYAALEQELFIRVNAHRDSIRARELEYDPALAEVARRHSRDMAEGRIPFGHLGFPARVAEAKRLGYLSLGENVAVNSYDPDTTGAVAFAGFIHSPAHRQTLELRAYVHTGVGVARDPRGYFYYTQLFAR